MKSFKMWIEDRKVMLDKRWILVPLLAGSLAIGACKGEIGGKVTKNSDGTVSGEIWGKITFLVPGAGSDHLGQLVAHLPNNMTIGTPTVTPFSMYVPVHVDRATEQAVESLLSNLQSSGFSSGLTFNEVLP